MNNRIKMPLSVYVLYHKDYNEGLTTYRDMYHLLCRDANNPLTDGIDIPVFLRTGGSDRHITDIDFSKSAKNAIFLLVDENMYNCPIWTKYIDNLIINLDSNTHIYAIPLCRCAFDINSALGKKQFIRLKDYSIKENQEEFHIRIFDILIRFILNKDKQKLKLFISHSKHDSDQIGEVRAEELRDFLRSDTKLDSFFDANDIQDGYDFEEQIMSNINESLLIVLKTDTYSEREWCRIETLAGKRSKTPAIVVNLIQGIVRRSFPYLGNAPVIRFNENWGAVVKLLLRTALDQYYQNLLLNELVNIVGPDNYHVLPFSPELLSFSLISRDKEKLEMETILYPEPPLGSEEIEFLKTFDDKLSFRTPMQAFTKFSKCLNNKQIAISISESEDINDYGGADALLNDITIELSRHILIGGGKLVYGGDLRKEGFTKKFKELSFQYGQSEKTDRTIKYFTNYFAWPIHLEMTRTDECDYEYSRVSIVKVAEPSEANDCKSISVKPISNPNKYLWAKSLTKMREEMEGKTDARIIMGGRAHNFKGKYAGVLEEFLIAKQFDHPIYLLGGFGGVSNTIINIIEGEMTNSILTDLYKSDSEYNEFVKYYNDWDKMNPIDYNNLTKIIKDGGISQLNNGLSKEENEILFHSTNVLEIVALILKGLNNKFK